MKHLKIILIVFSFLFTKNIFCQNQNGNSQIKGIIYDNNKNVLEGVHVTIPSIHLGVISDKDGKFLIKDLPKKTLKVQFSMIGFETLILNSTEDLSKITLHQSVIEIEDVVVSGGFVSTADRSAVKIESISSEELSFHAAPSLTLALADEPGIEMVKLGNGITKPVIRGLTGNRVVVLYKGARTANQAWGEEHGVFIPEEGIESVEIVKGPASLLFGSDAMGGVLNFIPIRPLLNNGRKNKFSTSYFSGSNGISSSLISQKRRKSWFHTYGLGYQNHADYKLPNSQFAHNSRYVNHYAFGDWGVSKPWGIFSGVYSSSYTNAGLVEGISQERERSLENPWQQVGDHFVTTEAVFWKNNWTFKPFVSYQLNHRKEFEDDHNHEKNEEEHNHASLDMSLRTARYDFKALQSNNLFEIILGSQGMYQVNTNEGEEILVPDALTNDIAIYSLFNKKLNNFQAQVGGRIDYRRLNFSSITKEFKDYTYSVGGTYQSSERYVFRTNIAKGFRSPNLFELTADGVHHGADRYEIGDENLLSEKNLEADVSFHIHGLHYVFDVSLFHNYINDYIYISPSSDTSDEGLSVYRHYQHDALLYGGEAGVDFHPHILHDLHVKSTISMVFGDNLELEEPLAMIPPHKWNNELEYTFRNLAFADKCVLSLHANHYFKQDRISSEEETTNSYTLVSLSSGITKGKHQLSLHVQNLLNKEYIPHLSLLKEQDVFEQGRSISLKYSINF